MRNILIYGVSEQSPGLLKAIEEKVVSAVDSEEAYRFPPWPRRRARFLVEWVMPETGISIHVPDFVARPGWTSEHYNRLAELLSRLLLEQFPDVPEIECIVGNNPIRGHWNWRRPTANLEMTDAHHRAVGSTVPQELMENPGKTLAETMDDETLAAFIRKEIEAVREAHTDLATGGDSRRRELLELVRDHFLLPNIRYLKRIRRLPAEFKGRDFAKEFAT